MKRIFRTRKNITSRIPPTAVGGSLRSSLHTAELLERIPPTAVGGSLKSSLPCGAGRTLTIPQLPLGGFVGVSACCVGRTLTIPQLPLGGLPKRELKFFHALSATLCLLLWTAAAQAQQPFDAKDFKLEVPALNLPLEPMQQAAFDAALKQRAFTEAETILINAAQPEYARNKKSLQAAQLYEAVGGVFFLNQEFLNAAISFKRADAITPLATRNRFTLAMSYIRLNRNDWAKPELERLVKEQPTNALYLYWLGRLDYDSKAYNEAIAKFTKVVALDANMMRAHDSLGLCYDYLGKYDEAVKHYRRAVELNAQQPQPTGWPHLNLAITLLAQNKVTEAETELRAAIRHDAQLPQAHYQLGLALEKLNKTAEAIAALEESARLDKQYAEPHYALGRLYQKQGDKVKAQAALAKFQELKAAQPK